MKTHSTHPSVLVAVATLTLALSTAAQSSAPAFAITGSLNNPRAQHTATLLPNGTVLLAGGDEPGFTPFNSSEVYNPATGTCTITSNLAKARVAHTATMLPNGKVLAAGGYGSTGFLSSAELRDPTTGTWILTGSMSTPRDSHTATLLPSGKVLITGGWNGSYLASAELYDLATGDWTTTGSLNIARSAHTATLLSNGKVLVAGGGNSTGTLSSAELYDPASGTWFPVNSMSTSREFATATLLPSGQVLMAGGLSGSTITASSELFNPATGTWTATGAMITTRAMHTATLLPNGTLLVVGGYINGNTCGCAGGIILASAEIYNPSAGTWSATTSMTYARYDGHTATLLANGQVFVAGGVGYNTWPSSAELYDPASGNWSFTALKSVAPTDSGHASNLGLTMGYAFTPNVNILVSSLRCYGANKVSIWTDSGSLLRSTVASTNAPAWQEMWLASPVTLSAGVRYRIGAYYPPFAAWFGLFSAPSGFSQGSFNGAYCVAGDGFPNGTGCDFAMADIHFMPGGSSLGTARSQHTATLLPSGTVLVAGGAGTNGASLSSTELYNPAAGTWTFSGTMTTYRQGHTAILLANGKVLVAGGANGAALKSAELYDPFTSTWTATGTMNQFRSFRTATLLPNGKVLVAGGYNLGSSVSSAEIYDPASGLWTATGSMNALRYLHTATLLPNGKVLVTGGSDGSRSSTNSTELYDPATGTWTLTGSMAAVREGHKATLLPNGKVLIEGGYNGDYYGPAYYSNAELYDPASGIWTVTGPMTMPRWNHTATLLFNGKVLVAGGSSTNYLSGAELYDPALGTWTAVGIMNTARGLHTATFLPDGRVLAAGGMNEGSSLIPGSATLSGTDLFDTGLGFNPSARPQIATITSPAGLARALTVTGAQFRGVSEGSCGNTADSPGDYPLVQLRSLETGQAGWLQPTSWSATSFACGQVWGCGPGYALATVFANGIPSTGTVLDVSIPVPTTTLLTAVKRTTNHCLQFAFTNAPGASFSILASTNPLLPMASWTALGGPTEIAPGVFQFTDVDATNYSRRFYRLRSL